MYSGTSRFAQLRPFDLSLGSTGACERREQAGFQIQPADAPIGDVGDEEAALAVEAAIVGFAHRGRGRLAAVAAEIFLAVAFGIFLHF